VTGYLGGLTITRVAWIGGQQIAVHFTSTYSGWYHQLYIGRVLTAVAESPGWRVLVGALKPSPWPQVVMILAVDPASRAIDFGNQLPPRPYNRIEVRATVSGWPADGKLVMLRAGGAPGQPVDPNNVLDRRLVFGDDTYVLRSPPMGPSGQYNVDVVAQDDKLPSGNLGSPATATVDLLTQPKDVRIDGAGKRLTASVAGNQTTLTWTNPA